MPDDAEKYRRYRQRHPERVREAQRRWRAAHPDYKRTYRLKNIDRLRAQERDQARRTDPAKKRIWRRAYRERHIDEVRAKEYDYQRAHPEVMNEIKRRHKERKRGAVGPHHTTREWQDLVALHAGCCFYCGETKRLERDHAIPLSRGGSDAIENIVPACRQCNVRKSSRTSQEFLAEAS